MYFAIFKLIFSDTVSIYTNQTCHKIAVGNLHFAGNGAIFSICKKIFIFKIRICGYETYS